MSRRNGVDIPLEFESDGIKRIVSLLHLLALMFGDPKVTVAIDELDSGVFEYLLGELTRILSESAKGQLVFTSHNLRPLVTIDRRFVAFRTTNPSSRYIRLKGTRDARNLRNFDDRDIQLGGQDEELLRIKSWARDVGPSTLAVVERIFDSVEIKEQAYNPALAVLNLTKTYTERDLEDACAYALERAARPRCRFIKSILASGAHRRGREDESDGGGYIRGAGYYEEGGGL